MARAFVVAMKSFFGLREDQKGSQDFVAELRTLSHEEKMQYAEMLREADIECDDPKPPKGLEGAG